MNILYGDSVKITGGFYEGCTGIVLDYDDNLNYLIEIRKTIGNCFRIKEVNINAVFVSKYNK